MFLCGGCQKGKRKRRESKEERERESTSVITQKMPGEKIFLRLRLLRRRRRSSYYYSKVGFFCRSPAQKERFSGRKSAKSL